MTEKQSKRTDFFTMIQEISAKRIHFVVLMLVIAPFLVPFNLPVPVTDATRRCYDQIHKLRAGDAVLYVNDFGAATIASFIGQSAALLNDIMRMKGVKVVMVTFFFPDGIPMHELYVSPKLDLKGYERVYGEDWVILGWIPGQEIGMAAFAKDTQKTVSTDYYGTPLSQIPIMKGIKSASDFKLVVTFTYYEQFIRQFYTPYGLPIVVGLRAASFPAAIPFMTTGQVVGILNDAIGAAEYEVLMGGYRGYGTMFLDSCSVVQAFVIVLVVLANLGYLVSQRRSKQGKMEMKK